MSDTVSIRSTAMRKVFASESFKHAAAKSVDMRATVEHAMKTHGIEVNIAAVDAEEDGSYKVRWQPDAGGDWLHMNIK